MKKLLIIILIILIITYSYAYADEMILVGYKEAPDCKYKSTKVCHTDEHGQEHCQIKQDDRCNNE